MTFERRALSPERTAIFIDGWNFAKATYEGLGVRVDFKRLLATLTAGRTLLRATYYIGEWTDDSFALLTNLRRARVVDGMPLPADPQESERKRLQQQGFIRMLNRNGYQVVKRPVVVFADGGTKAHIGIDVAIDMLSLAEYCDRMVLVSGDGDFVPVVRAVAARGVRVQVVASQVPLAANAVPDHPRPFPVRASDELLDAADEFSELKDLIPDIELQEPRRPAPRPFVPLDAQAPSGQATSSSQSASMSQPAPQMQPTPSPQPAAQTEPAPED